MAQAPTVMVSSTFYDLKQVRQDLASFLMEALGYQALLSELPSFPVNPDLDTVANCKRRVEDDADILVLVIGGRYGSIDDRSAKSVTNIEYLTARAKGIPIYVFVESRILNILPVWKANQDGDYTGVVDTPELFQFVDSIRTEQQAWTFSFEVAQDIIAILRVQLAHRCLEGLRLSRRLRGTGTPPYLDSAGPRTLRTALEKPSAWEYQLFFQACLDEIERRSWLLRDHRAGVALGLSEDVPAHLAAEWILTRSHELQGLVATLNHLLNVEAGASFGEPGQPGDPDHIMWAARKLGDILQVALEWSHRIRRARVHEPFKRAAREMSAFANDLVDQIVAFPSSKLAQIEDALVAASAGRPQTLQFTLTITLSNLEAFTKALEEARAHYAR
jgi:Domain of unknown function (DUF4062)